MNPFDSDGSKEEIQVSVRKSNKKKTKLRFKKKKKPKNPEHAITVPNLYDVEDKGTTDLVHNFASKGNFPEEKKSKYPFNEGDDGDEEAEDEQFPPKAMEEPELNISRQILGLNHKGVILTEKDDKITDESLKRKRSSSVRQRMSKLQKSLRKRSKSHPEGAKCKSASETQKEVTHEVSRQSPVSDLKIMEPISTVSAVEGRLVKGKRKSTNPFEEDDDDYIEESIPQRNLTSERKYMAAPFLRPDRQDIGISPKTRLSKDDETNQTAMIDRNPMPRNVPSSLPRNVQTLVPSNVPSSVPRIVLSSAPNNVSSSVPRNAKILLPSNVPSSVATNVLSSVPRNVPMIDSNRPSNMVKQIDGEERDSSTKKKKSLSIHRQLSRIQKSLKKKPEGDAKDGSQTDSSTTVEMTKISSVESNVESQPRTKREDSRPEERIGLKAMNLYEERAIDVPHPINVRSIPIKEAKEHVDFEVSKSTNEVEDTVANENEKGDDKKRYPFQLTRSLSKVRSSFRKKSKSQEKEKNENADIQQEVLASVTVESINNQSDENYHGEGFLDVNRLPKNPFETDEPEQVDDDVVEIVDETTEKSNNGSQVSFRGFSKLRSSFKRKSKNLQKESPKEVPLETSTESDILKKNQENAREEVELSPAGMSPKKQQTIDEVLADLGCTPDGREISPTDDPFDTDEENVNLKKKNPLQRGVSKVRSSFRRKPKNDEGPSESAFKDKDQAQNKQESVKEEVELTPPVQVIPQKQPTVEEVLADLGCTPDGREINPTDNTFEETAHDDDNDGENIYGKNKNLLQRRAFKLRSPFKKKSKNPLNETLSDSTDIHRDMSKNENVNESEQVLLPLVKPSTKREAPKAEVLSDREFSPEERGTTDIPEKSSNKQKPKKKKHKKHEERDTECIEPLLKPITTMPMRSEDFTVEFRGPQKVPPTKHQLIEMRSTVDDVKHSLCDNLLKLEDRAGNLDDLEALADSLSEKTTYFVKCSSKVKKKMRCRDYKWRIIIFTSVSIIILVVVLVIIVFITKNTDNNQSKTLVATNVTNNKKY